MIITVDRQPNTRLRDARTRLTSPHDPGKPMSRQELADAINAWLFERLGVVRNLDAQHIRRYETGQHRRPCREYRQALCAVLGADEQALGFS